MPGVLGYALPGPYVGPFDSPKSPEGVCCFFSQATPLSMASDTFFRNSAGSSWANVSASAKSRLFMRPP